MQRARVTVPAAVRALVQGTTGADLGDVEVHRGPEASATADAIGARAFTSEGRVHLPAELGPLSSDPARSLLAHELTHVVQQRALGSALPAEDSPAGARLEAAAVRTERLTARAPRPSSPTPPGATATPAGGRTADGALVLTPPRRPDPEPPGPGPVVQRAAAPPVPAAAPPGLAPTGPAPSAAQVPPDVPEAPRAAPTPSPAPESSAAKEGAAGGSEELDELARRLWPRIQSRLRADLLVARERTGTFVDRL